MKIGGLGIRTITQFTGCLENDNLKQIARVTQEAASEANFNFVAGGADLSGAIQADFEFNGLPTSIDYGGSTNILTWLFNKVFQFFSFISTLVINVIKASILGYVSMVDALISNLLHATEGAYIENGSIKYAYVENIQDKSFSFYNVEEKKQFIKPIEAYSNAQSNNNGDDRYTIEDIIYNNIPILDVNVFSNTPGGKAVDSNSTTEIIRKAVSNWYIAFRNLSIMAIAIIIVYIGIRIALSTIPEKGSQYKTALMSWGISIVLIFTLHYFMIIVFNINEELVELFQSTMEGENVIYDTIATRAADMRLYIGIPATIMYTILVIFFARFLWIYVKRYFTIMILIVIAPFVCAKYAFDSASGKKGPALTNWMYDLTMSTLLQSVHALLYTVFMGMAVDYAITSVWGFIIALVLINFIMKADKIFMKIFKFERSGSVGDVDKQFSKEDIAGAFVVYSYMKKSLNDGIKLGKNSIKYGKKLGERAYSRIGRNEDSRLGKVKSEINNLLDKRDEFLAGAYDTMGMTKKSDKAQLRKLARKGGEIGREAKRTLKNRQKVNKERRSATWKLVKGIPGGIGKMALGIPMFVIEPKVGYAMLTKGYKQYKTIAGLKRNGGRKTYTAKNLLAQFMSAGAYGIVKNAKSQEKKQRKKESKITKNTRYLNEANTKYEEAKEKWNDAYSDLSYEEKKAEMKKIRMKVVDASKSNIKDEIIDYMSNNQIRKIDDSNIEDMVEKTLENLRIKESFSDKQIQELKQEMMNLCISDEYKEKGYLGSIEQLAEEMHEKILDIEKPQSFNFETDSVKEFIEEKMNTETIEKIDDTNIDNMIEATMNKVGINNSSYTRETLDEIIRKVKSEYHFEGDSKAEQIQNLTGKLQEVANEVEHNIMKNKEATEYFDNIEKVNEKAKKDIKTSVIDTDRIITQTIISDIRK